MERRDVLNLGGLAMLASMFFDGEAMAQNASAAKGQSTLLRICEDARGDSRFEELTIAVKPTGRRRDSLILPAKDMFIGEYTPNDILDWHRSPARQFGITIVGELEVEVSGGARRRVKRGDLVFLEDTKGKGHITRLQGPVTNLFIRVPETFDVVAWSRGASS